MLLTNKKEYQIHMGRKKNSRSPEILSSEHSLSIARSLGHTAYHLASTKFINLNFNKGLLPPERERLMGGAIRCALQHFIRSTRLGFSFLRERIVAA